VRPAKHFPAWPIVFIILSILNEKNLIFGVVVERVTLSPVPIAVFQAVLVATMIFTRTLNRESAAMVLILLVGFFAGFLGGNAATLALAGLVVLFNFVAITIPLAARTRTVATYAKASALPVGDGAERPTQRPKGSRILLVDLISTAGTMLVLFGLAVLASIPPSVLALAMAFVLVVPIGVTVLDVVFRIMIPPHMGFYHPALTHHLPDEADHAIGVQLGNLTVFLCTRCTGMITGLLSAIYIFASLSLYIPPFTALIIDIFLPMPIFIDWGLQRLGVHKSTTVSRTLTGSICGLGFYFLTFTIGEYALASSILLGIYFVIFFVIYFISYRIGYPFEESGLVPE